MMNVGRLQGFDVSFGLDLCSRTLPFLSQQLLGICYIALIGFMCVAIQVVVGNHIPNYPSRVPLEKALLKIAVCGISSRPKRSEKYTRVHVMEKSSVENCVHAI